MILPRNGPKAQGYPHIKIISHLQANCQNVPAQRLTKQKHDTISDRMRRLSR